MRDRYGLPLSTVAPAAELYNHALDRLLALESGAEVLLEQAVAVDPGFALGHAALAVVGSEFGVRVDVRTHLAAARRHASRAGERERSFVSAVHARIAAPARVGAQQLLRHIDDHPRDALAVTMAVPTIAFAGAVDVPEQAWQLVESLQPVYGSDWWFLGLLAFIRQEQNRFADAAELAEAGLSLRPQSGHAAHSLAHAYFETGRHDEGLAWLDGWIARCGGGAVNGVHFSWHAALHELAMGDDAGVRRRYLAQIAPPHASGTRALVDSGSLLWRCQLNGSWAGAVPIEDVLAEAGESALLRPSNAFVGLHGAIALAAAGDATGLRRLARWVAASPRPEFGELLAPVVSAMTALVGGRPDRAADLLLALPRRTEPLGGSAAQREVLEDTLLYALMAAERWAEAGRILDARLDRRPNPRDSQRRQALAPVPG